MVVGERSTKVGPSFGCTAAVAAKAVGTVFVAAFWLDVHQGAHRVDAAMCWFVMKHLESNRITALADNDVLQHDRARISFVAWNVRHEVESLHPSRIIQGAEELLALSTRIFVAVDANNKTLVWTIAFCIVAQALQSRQQSSILNVPPVGQHHVTREIGTLLSYIKCREQ